MENPAANDGHEQAKKKAKAFYKTIGHVWCPALNDHVRFSTAGFHHLAWKQNYPRRKSEQIKRFAFISDAKAIIASRTTITEHRMTDASYDTYRRGKRKITVSTANFWSLTKKRNGKAITVIIRQLKGGEKHFFSVFSK